jgi:hypothetical protein
VLVVALTDLHTKPAPRPAAPSASTAIQRRSRVPHRRPIRLLGDRWLEVAAAAAEALGHVGGETDARPALLARTITNTGRCGPPGFAACMPGRAGRAATSIH